jgi:hypothetical protein
MSAPRTMNGSRRRYASANALALGDCNTAGDRPRAIQSPADDRVDGDGSGNGEEDDDDDGVGDGNSVGRDAIAAASSLTASLSGPSITNDCTTQTTQTE